MEWIGIEQILYKYWIETNNQLIDNQMDNQLNLWQVLAQHLAAQNEWPSETFQQALEQILVQMQLKSTCTKVRLPNPERFNG